MSEYFFVYTKGSAALVPLTGTHTSKTYRVVIPPFLRRSGRSIVSRKWLHQNRFRRLTARAMLSPSNWPDRQASTDS